METRNVIEIILACTKLKKLLPQNLQYKSHQIPKLKCFSYRLAVVFAQYIEVKCSVDHIWVISNFIANTDASYVRGLTVYIR